LQTTAKMTFQMVDITNDLNAAIASASHSAEFRTPGNVAGERRYRSAQPVLVEKRVLIAGDRLKDAGWTNDQQTGQVAVTFRFDSVGAKEFAEITKENVGKPFAIVLDKKVLTAPNIREPILAWFRPDHRQLHRPVGQRSGGAAARRRAARAVEADRPAHRRSRTRQGLDREAARSPPSQGCCWSPCS
jgi:preprotein translocase subunit SecD